jgi:hypothetical protein
MNDKEEQTHLTISGTRSAEEEVIRRWRILDNDKLDN